jgi:hypothetical protein
MFLLHRLKNLFDAFTLLAANFPAVQVDAQELMNLVEHALLTKSWNLATVLPLFAEVQSLVTNFTKMWQGSRADLTKFEDAFKALLARP